MATKRAWEIHDYHQLNSLSSVVLCDTAPRLKKSKNFYEVERVITKQRINFVSVYLMTNFHCFLARETVSVYITISEIQTNTMKGLAENFLGLRYFPTQ